MDEDKHKLTMHSNRLEALGDGIFSVAMTILVIEIKLPIVKGNSWNNVVHAFNESSREMLCYFISFIVLGIMWFGHRIMFEYITKTNRYFIFLGVLFYMVICFVPFSTRFLAANTLTWYGITIYGLNLTLCNLTLFAQWMYGIHKPALHAREIPQQVKKEAKNQMLLSPVVYTVAIIVSFFIPQISIAIFIITPIVYLIPNILDKYLP